MIPAEKSVYLEECEVVVQTTGMLWQCGCITVLSWFQVSTWRKPKIPKICPHIFARMAGWRKEQRRVKSTDRQLNIVVRASELRKCIRSN